MTTFSKNTQLARLSDPTTKGIAMASSVSKAHASYYNERLKITITGADPHYFQSSDIGKSFVRTQPYRHYDFSYLARGSTERSIRESAYMLEKLTNKHLKFREELSLPWDPNYKLENPDWNDGNWIEIEKCVAICKNTLNLGVDSDSESDSDYLQDL